MANTEKADLRVTEGWEADPASHVSLRSAALFKHERPILYWSLVAGVNAAAFLAAILLNNELGSLSYGFVGFTAALTAGLNRQVNKSLWNLESIATRHKHGLL